MTKVDSSLLEIESVPAGFALQHSPYSVTYTVQALVDRFQSNNLILPDFQRRFVWSRKAQHKFLRDTLVSGIPIISILFITDEDGVDKRPHILDGLQRLSTLSFFVGGYVNLGPGTTYNKSMFKDLPKELQDKILQTEVQITKMSAKRDFWGYLFRSYNSGNTPLSAVELRRSVYEKLSLLFELDQLADHNNEWIALYGKNNRNKGLQILLRTLAMHYTYQAYQKPLEQFLDRFCNALMKTPGEIYGQPEALVIKRLNLIIKALYQHPKLGKSSFRLDVGKPVNLGVLDFMIHSAFMLLDHDKKLENHIDKLGTKLHNIKTQALEDQYTMQVACCADTSGRENTLIRLSLVEELTKREF